MYATAYMSMQIYEEKDFKNWFCDPGKWINRPVLHIQVAEMFSQLTLLYYLVEQNCELFIQFTHTCNVV